MLFNGGRSLTCESLVTTSNASFHHFLQSFLLKAGRKSRPAIKSRAKGVVERCQTRVDQLWPCTSVDCLVALNEGPSEVPIHGTHGICTPLPLPKPGKWNHPTGFNKPETPRRRRETSVEREDGEQQTTRANRHHSTGVCGRDTALGLKTLKNREVMKSRSYGLEFEVENGLSTWTDLPE